MDNYSYDVVFWVDCFYEADLLDGTFTDDDYESIGPFECVEHAYVAAEVISQVRNDFEAMVLVKDVLRFNDDEFDSILDSSVIDTFIKEVGVLS